MFKKPHRHAEFIHAYADGAQIQMRSDGEWIDREQPDWSADEYRIKPADQTLCPPSSLSYSDLCFIVNLARGMPGMEGEQTKIARLAADTAVERFITQDMQKYLEEKGVHLS